MDEHIFAIEQHIIDPLNSLFLKQKNEEMLTNLNWFKSEIKYHEESNLLETYKKEFLQAYNIFDRGMANFDLDNKKLKNYSEKKKLSQKIYQLYTNYKNAEKLYKKYFHSVKFAKINYEKDLGNTLKEYQTINQERYNSFKEGISSFFAKENEMNERHIESSKSIYKVITTLILDDDNIKGVLEKLEKDELPKITFHSIPEKYKETTDKLDEFYLNNKSAENIDIEEIRLALLDSNSSQKIPEVIETMLTNIWNNGKIITTLLPEFNKVIGAKEGRMQFCEAFNTFRSKGIFLMNKNSYKAMIELLRIILNEADKNTEVDIGLKILILSLTYYAEFPIKEGITNKIYLQQKLGSHPIWKREDFWEKAIYVGIEEDKNNTRINATEEDQELVLKRSVFGKLATFSQNMIDAKLSFEFIRETIVKHAKSSKLFEEDINSLLVVFN